VNEQPSTTADSVAAPLVWSWPDAWRGLVYGLPAAVVTVADPARGIPLAVGVLPACLLPLAARRRGRIATLAVGTVAGAGILVGGVLAHASTLVTALLLVAVVVAAAVSASRAPWGRLLLVLAAPLVAAGLSYDDWSSSIGAAVLLTAGAAYAWVVSLLWPEHEPGPARAAVLPERTAMLRYGLLLGTGSAIAYLVASAWHVDHPGWAPAACLLVARPVAGLLRTRAVGRVLAVAAGACLAIAVVEVDAVPAVLAVLAALTVVAAAAMRTSRWYITSAFTTFLVFLMLLGPDVEQAQQAFVERVGETVLGVGLAVLFGIVVPQVLAGRDRVHTRSE
jgi:hypothetical protein